MLFRQDYFLPFPMLSGFVGYSVLFDANEGINRLGHFRDMTLTLPGTPWRKEQTKDLQRVLKAVDGEIPLVFVSGNHDVGNIPTPETIAEFQQTWGDDYFSFWVGGVLFLVLNSQFLFDASRCPALKQAQDQWLDQQLSVARRRACRHAIVFQHIPLFLQSIDEEDDYFNLTTSVRKEMADKFARAGSAWTPRCLGGRVVLEKRWPDPSPAPLQPGKGERGWDFGRSWVRIPALPLPGCVT